MEIIITEIAQRIRDLREIMGYSVEEMAQAVTAPPKNILPPKKAKLIFLSRLFTSAPRSSTSI